MSHTGPQFIDCSDDVFGGASHPLTFDTLKTFVFKTLPNCGVTKVRAIDPLSKFVDFDDVSDAIHTLGLPDSDIDVDLGRLANLQTTFKFR
jgi:hypothetical protein